MAGVFDTPPTPEELKGSKGSVWDSPPTPEELGGTPEAKPATSGLEAFLSHAFPESLVTAHFGLLNPGAVEKLKALRAQTEQDSPTISALGNVAQNALPVMLAGEAAPLVAFGQGLMQTPLKRVDTPQEANDEGVRAFSNAALSAGAVALGSKFPTATGLGLAGLGAASGDPLATVGGGLMALFGASGLAGKLGAKAAEKTEAGVLAMLAKKALPAERQAAAAGNRGAQRSLLERFKLLQGSTEPVEASPIRQSQAAEQQEATKALADENRSTQKGLVERFKQLQTSTEPVEASPIRQSQAAEREQAAKSLTEQNRADKQRLLERFRTLRGATEPIRANTTPNAGTPNPDAQALGQLGSEVQENFRYLRSKDPLGLKLTPEAEAGTQAILPDYETQANQQLARFAQGKGARLEEIKRSLQEAANAPKPGAGPQSMLMDPKLLESNTLKPNPLAGFSPRTLPETPALPARLGLPDATLQHTLRPNPLAGFTPKTLPPATPPLPPQLGFADATLQGLTKPNPLAGFTPKPPPSLEEMAARLKDAGQPQAEIAAMRARQGIPERMAGLATKAVGLQGAMRLGDLSAAVKDPVLAHYLVKPAAKVLQSAPQIAARVLPFLRGAEGSVLLTKLRYLMKNDPQFADAMKAANETPAESP